jgi:hypothetical protein
MYLSAYVRDKSTEQTLVIARDYSSKEKFARDLRGNGYAVIRISNHRDIASQDYGYESFAEMKKYSHHYERIAEIQKIEL